MQEWNQRHSFFHQEEFVQVDGIRLYHSIKRGVENAAADVRLEGVGVKQEKAEMLAVTERITEWINEKKSYIGDEWVVKVGTQEIPEVSVHQGVIRMKGRLYVGTI